MMRSNSLSMALKRQIGRYDDGCSSGLSSFRINTSLAVFHVLGKAPYFKHRLNISRRTANLLAAISFTIISGTPSRPGDLPSVIFELHSITSIHVISEKPPATVVGGHVIKVSLGNKASIMSSSLLEIVSPGIALLPTSFFVTISYGSP